MCYLQFFNTFGDSIQKCIKSVLLQGIVVQIRMGSGGGLDWREGDCERPSHEAPGNRAFLPGWAKGLQSAASPVVVSSFLTDPIGCS